MIFVLLGLTAAKVSDFLFTNKVLLQRIGGFVIIIFALEFSGVVNVSLFNEDFKISLPKNFGGYFRPFLMGVIFSLSWSAYTGVVLGSMLALAASSANAIKGAVYLLVYSLGMSTPFVLVPFSITAFPKHLQFIKRYSNN